MTMSFGRATERSAEEISARLAEHFRARALPEVISVYLFGAYAQKRAHRESDVDVGVLLDRARLPDAGSRFDWRVRATSDLIGALSMNEVDLVVLNDVPPELGRAVVTRGVRVFCGDAERDHAFVRDVQLRAADLAPWLERMRRIKLEALLR